MELTITSETYRCPNAGDIAYLTLCGPLAQKSVQIFEATILDLYRKGISKIILDFAQAMYLNSTGVGLLINIAHKVNVVGGGIRLIHVADKFRVLFDMLGLEPVLPIFNTREDALFSFGTRPESLVLVSPSDLPAGESDGYEGQSEGKEEEEEPKENDEDEGKDNDDEDEISSLPQAQTPPKLSVVSPPKIDAADFFKNSGDAEDDSEGDEEESWDQFQTGGALKFAPPTFSSSKGKEGKESKPAAETKPARKMLFRADEEEEASVTKAPSQASTGDAKAPSQASTGDAKPRTPMFSKADTDDVEEEAPAKPSVLSQSKHIEPPRPSREVPPPVVPHFAPPEPVLDSGNEDEESSQPEVPVAPPKQEVVATKETFEAALPEKAAEEERKPALPEELPKPQEVSKSNAPAQVVAVSLEAKVEYHERMCQAVAYQTWVSLKTVKEGEKRAQLKNSLVVLVPRFPGSHIVPDRIPISAARESTEVGFWVTPLCKKIQNGDSGCIEIWYQGMLVDAIQVPFKIAKPWYTLILGFCTLIFPILGWVLEAYQIPFAASELTWKTAGVIVGGIFFLLTLFSFLKFREQEGEPLLKNIQLKMR